MAQADPLRRHCALPLSAAGARGRAAALGRLWRALGSVAAALVLGCGQSGPKATAGSASAGGSSALARSAATIPARLQGRPAELMRAELSRRPELVRDADLGSRDVEVRRAAARALSRIGTDAARAGLLRALADDDPEVAAWAAYGLGSNCAGHAEEHVRALSAAAVRFLPAAEASPAATDAGAPAAEAGPVRIEPIPAFARAIGRCGGPDAEPTLVGWTRSSRAAALGAVLGLGDLAEQQQKLREESYAALLNLCAGDVWQSPLPEAFFPFSRVKNLPPSVIERTREVAQKALAAPGPARLFAILALARTEDAAAPLLGEVVRHAEQYSAAERNEAVLGLVRLGAAGQRTLEELLPVLAPPGRPLEATSFVGEDFVVLLSVLDALGAVGKNRAQLQRLASLSVLPELPRPVQLRVSHLRCAAAKLLSERDFAAPVLATCDLLADRREVGKSSEPASGIGARAVVQAIGIAGAEIKGERLSAWRRYAQGADLRAREAAIELIADHPEIEEAAAELAHALRADAPGPVVAAAEVIAKVPARASKGARKKRGPHPEKDKPGAAGGPPHPDVVAALIDRLDGKGPTADVEALGAVIDAVAALAIDAARPALGALCRSPHRTIRERAQKALTSLSGGNETPRCDPPPEGMVLPPELDKLTTAPTTLELATDVGNLVLRLDPTLAPAAVSRIVDLARAGFYRGIVVDRVVPGFVAQLGSPTADSYGGADRPALACETSPVPFVPGSVGMALSGRDTGSSQLFVTHATFPHLDGRYAWIGTASGPWGALVEGDVVHEVRVLP